MKNNFFLLFFAISARLVLAESFSTNIPIVLTNPFKETRFINSFNTNKRISKLTTIKMHFENTENSKLHLLLIKNGVLQKERPKKILYLIGENNYKERHWFTLGGMVVGGTAGYWYGYNKANKLRKSSDPFTYPTAEGVGFLNAIGGIIIGGFVGYIIDEIRIN